jgi:hypothetical protein
MDESIAERLEVVFDKIVGERRLVTSVPPKHPYSTERPEDSRIKFSGMDESIAERLEVVFDEIVGERRLVTSEVLW